MKTSAIHPTKYSVLLLVLSIVVSCDSFDDSDSVEPSISKADYYTLPGSSVIIDLTSLGEQSFSSASLTVSSQPLLGKLTPVDDLLFKYSPAWDFQSGSDNFVVTVISDGKILADNTVRIHMKTRKEEFPCTLIAVEDKVKFKGAMSHSIPVLANDWFCDIDKTNLSISIHSQPLYGKVTVDGESIRYTFDTPFQRDDTFIYQLKTSTGNVSYGFVSLAEWTAETLETPPDYHLWDMFFLDENVGFTVGNKIYKTEDGGKHWLEVSPSKGPWFVPSFDESGYGSFVDITFLNEKEGFALYVPCDPGWIQDCGIGLVNTKDGGISWKVIPIDTIDMATSIFFISSTTGFIGGVLPNYNNYDESVNVILKTIDGGTTWRQVLVTQDVKNGEGLTIKFADDQIGYAHQRGYESTDRIYITQDGGESWKTFTTYEHISAMAVISKNEIFANLTTFHAENAPSSIVRFGEASSEGDQIADFPYKILKLEFSPSGNVGFGIGINGENILAVNKTNDKGETWSEQHFEKFRIREDGYSPYFLEAMTIPTDNVAYILYGDKIIKYSNK
jgi:photosystem II stability/assembly factor-like uncharacterized protein